MFQLVLKELVHQLADVLIRPFTRRKNEGPVPVDFSGAAHREHLKTCPELAIVGVDPQGTERANVVGAGNSNGCGLPRIIRVK
jgi:hypothetical protein